MVKECNIAIEGITYAYADLSSLLRRHDEIGDYNEIIFVTSGRAVAIDKSETLEVSPGMLLLLPQNSKARIALDSQEPLWAHVLRFSESDLVADTARIFERMLEGTVGLRYYTLPMLPVNVISIFDRLSVATRFSSHERASYLRLMISEILLSLSIVPWNKLSAITPDLGARVQIGRASCREEC